MFSSRIFLLRGLSCIRWTSPKFINNSIRCYNSNNENNTPPDDHLLRYAIKNNSKIAYYGQDRAEDIYNVLLKFGFTPENAVTVLNKNTDILRINGHQLEKRLEMWHACQFSRTQFYELFVQCPELLDLDDENHLNKRYAQLRSIVATPKNIWRLLMASPNVLYDDMHVINQKVDYVVEKMEADITDLVKSGTLGLSLDEIETRHTLMVRLGIYKKRNYKAKETDPNKNPRLFRIMDCSHSEFARKVCGISNREAEAFYELFERELIERRIELMDYQEDSDLESDVDTDSDEANFDARERGDYYDDRDRRKYDRHRNKSHPKRDSNTKNNKL